VSPARAAARSSWRTPIGPSTSRQRAARAACDVYFNPPLDRIGLLAWKHFDSIVAQGRAHAEEVLQQPDVHALLKPDP